jgi:5-methylcytosine-specific restriction enzyme subunit McrC
VYLETFIQAILESKMANGLITKFEYDYLTTEELTENEISELLRINEKEKLNFRREGNKLKLSQYVGLIFLSSGRMIEILPKVTSDREEVREVVKARKLLCSLLYEFFDLSKKGLYGGSIGAYRTNFEAPFFEILTMYILRYAEKQIIQPGIYKHYERKSSVSRNISGKLLLTQTVLKFPHQKEKFVIERESFTANVPVNRIVLSVSEWVLNNCKNQKTKTLAEKVFTYLKNIGVERPQAVTNELKRCSLNRINKHYYPVIQFAKLLLTKRKLVSEENYPFSFLFDMNKLFEMFVAKSLPDSIYDNSKNEKISEDFILKPDILIPLNSSRSLAVIDTKWKFPRSSTSNSGINQNDRFQVISYMYVLSERRGVEIPLGILLYPELQQEERKVWHLSQERKLVALSLGLKKLINSKPFIESPNLDEATVFLKQKIREKVKKEVNSLIT